MHIEAIAATAQLVNSGKEPAKSEMVTVEFPGAFVAAFVGVVLFSTKAATKGATNALPSLLVVQPGCARSTSIVISCSPLPD
jgi:hypothetical protein